MGFSFEKPGSCDARYVILFFTLLLRFWIIVLTAELCRGYSCRIITRGIQGMLAAGKRPRIVMSSKHTFPLLSPPAYRECYATPISFCVSYAREPSGFIGRS